MRFATQLFYYKTHFYLFLKQYFSIMSKAFFDINIGDETEHELNLKQFKMTVELYEKVNSYAGFSSESFEVYLFLFFKIYLFLVIENIYKILIFLKKMKNKRI